MEWERIAVVACSGLVDGAWLERCARDWSESLGVTLDLRVAEPDDLATAAFSEAGSLLLVPGPGIDRDDVVAAVRAAADRVVVADLDDADRPRPRLFDHVPVVRGRGLEGIRWGASWLLQRLAWPFRPVAYGPGPDRCCDLRLPQRGRGPWPVVVVVHGGFWGEPWLRDTTEPLAVDLARRGYATWSIEYRRVGPFGGGWPATLVDVAAAVDALAEVEAPLDLGRLALVGHSAGAQLAAWAVRREGVECPAPRVRPALVASLAGALDLEGFARRAVGDGNPSVRFLGGHPDEVPERYASASPRRLLPLGVPQVVVQGLADDPSFVDLGRAYVREARASGDAVEHLEVEGADHFAVVDPAAPAWSATVGAIARGLA